MSDRAKGTIMDEPLEECIHGLGPVEACVECNGRAQREREAAAEAPRFFPAKFPGQCPGCNLLIVVGERIGYVEGQPVKHEKCWVDQPAPRTPTFFEQLAEVRGVLDEANRQVEE